MDRTDAKQDRRSQIAMASFFALTGLLAVAAALSADHAQPNAPLRAALFGTMN
jgi:hypothetical protein